MITSLENIEIKKPLPVYLDYAASTPLDPEVLATMLPFLHSLQWQGNSSSNHYYGRMAAKAIEEAREYVASLINATAEEIIFTSGATEANHLAIQGAAHFYQKQGRHIISSAIEHSSVLAALQQLRQQQFKITQVKVNQDGRIPIDNIRAALQSDTTLISLMYVNNETGVIQPIEHLKTVFAASHPHLKLHSDAVAAAGKIPIDVKKSAIDYLCLASHKLYGPKGVGALYIRNQPKARLMPFFPGTQHEAGIRSGTLATAIIVGFGSACMIAKKNLEKEANLFRNFQQQLLNGINDLSGIVLNGSSASLRAPHILNITVTGINGEALLQALPDLAISTGSACHAHERSVSHVLTAMGLPIHLAHASLRISIGRLTTKSEIEYTIKRLRQEIIRLRSMAPPLDNF